MNLKRLALGLLLATLLMAQAVSPITLPDFTGDGSTHALASTGTARWLIFTCPSGNHSPVRIGDVSTTSTQGAACYAGETLTFPAFPLQPQDNPQGRLYVLSKIYYNAYSGDKLSVTGVN